MYIDLVAAMTQTALIVLKLLGRFDRSWFFAFLPSVIWLVVRMIFTAAGMNDAETDRRE